MDGLIGHYDKFERPHDASFSEISPYAMFADLDTCIKYCCLVEKHELNFFFLSEKATKIFYICAC